MADAPAVVEVQRDGEVARLRLDPATTNAFLLLTELDAALGRLEEWIGAGEVARVVVLGGEGGWPSRMELEELRGEQDAAAGAELSLFGQRVLRRLEQLPVSTVALVEGPCLATGLQVALACAHRLAVEGPRTRLGAPEVRTGLTPAYGATVRLPRLVGWSAALELLLTGRSVAPPEALALGLVDAVLPAASTAADAAAWLTAEEGARRAAGRRGVRTRLLEDTAPGRRLLLPRLRRRLLPPVAYAAPAPQRVLELVVESASGPADQAYHREAEVYGEVAAGERPRALAYAARVPREALMRLPVAGAPIEQVGIVGAGPAGSDLAYLLASAGVPVRLRDGREALAAGRRRVLRRFALDVQAGRIPEAEADRRAALVATGTGWGGFGTADLVVVAGGREEEELRATLHDAGRHTRDACLLAVVSQALTATAVADGLERPERLLSLRFATPIDRFPAAEVAATPDTLPAAAAACARLLRQAGRAPLSVADRPGGASGRLLALLLAEGARLADEGAGADLVDRIAEDYGFLVGPFRRIDSLGAEATRQLLRQLAVEYGPRFTPAPLLDRAADAGAEFYLYQSGRPAGPNPALPAGIRAGGQGMVEVIRYRLLLLLVNEAALLLEEGTADAPTLEAAALLGVGFPRARGGLLYQADRLGLPRLVDLLDDHARRFGERFAPAPLLRRLAEQGGSLTGHRPSTPL